MTEEEFREECDLYMGYCTTCDAFTRECCEPDAREYDCPVCRSNTVYGAEEALMMELITLE